MMCTGSLLDKTHIIVSSEYMALKFSIYATSNKGWHILCSQGILYYKN